MSTFMGLEIGKRSIMTHQTALNITGHNVANANTAGYTRQVANITTTAPWHTPVLTGNAAVGQMGTGVQVSDIQRLRDAFVDAQIRHENKTEGYWESLQNTYAKIEVILNEPSENGLRSVMDQFWQAWQDLSASPESDAVRAVVAERGAALADTFNHTYRQLVDLREDLNASVKVKVDEINSIAQQIKDLNLQILTITNAGKQPNDLLDKRDLLLDDLSKIVDITIYEEPDTGMVAVQAGDRNLVQGIEMTKMSVEADSNGMYMVVWADTKTKARLSTSGGELAGLLDARGKTELPQDANSKYKEIIPTLLNELNTMAKTIVITTNNIHRGGYSLNNQTAYPDGTNFFDQPADFTGNWAEKIKVSDDIANDIKNIAAAEYSTWDSTGKKSNFGDGNNALKIAQLKQTLNASEVLATSGDLSLTLTFPGTTSGDITVTYAGAPVTIHLDAPAENYNDLQKLANSIQAALDASTDLEKNVKVRCDGKSLVFYSASDKFGGVTDAGLLGTTSFTTSPASPNDMVTDTTVDDYWRLIAAEIGVQSQEAIRMTTNQELLLSQLEEKRQSVSGVSLDEEMTNMIKYQHAYNAAARFITTIDEQIETIVNRLGLVGR
ncbi:MAG: flagellar hook-associated protein FlgK [Syntrophomonadaceae bacterium]